jgi:prepilin-type N-terminal cleavage/methylation domain-containing protein
MEQKTHFKINPKFSNQAGFNLMELLISSTIFLLIVTFVIVLFNPVERNKKARDEKRISDITKIDRAISEFVLDRKSYPDLEGFLRTSNVLPEGGVALNKSNGGWILENLSSYIPMLPTDPINDETYHYYYLKGVGNLGYELNAKLESLVEEMTLDGGNDNNFYEVGSNLKLISP